MRQLFPGEIYQAPGTLRVRRVMTGIARNCPWQLKEKSVDLQGRYIILKGLWANQPLTVTGVYVPHTLQVPFWSELFDLVSTINILLLGDFKATFDNFIDRS